MESLPQRAQAPIPDAQLVKRMAAGEESALAEVYDLYSAQVYGLVLRVLTNHAEAEEILEEVFFQAWREAERYDGTRGTVAAWLFAIARSRAIDRIRSRQRRDSRMVSLDDAPPVNELAVIGGSPEDDTLDAERRRIVKAALDQLPVKQREAMELAYFGGFSQSEIANLTGEPLGTIKTRMRSAMTVLRERLALLWEGAS